MVAISQGIIEFFCCPSLQTSTREILMEKKRGRFTVRLKYQVGTGRQTMHVAQDGDELFAVETDEALDLIDLLSEARDDVERALKPAVWRD